MFAIMKFQQRTNAAAFSHAFVLTIRTFPSSEHSLFELKYPTVKEADAGTTFKDLNSSLDTKEKLISTVISATDKVTPRKAAICPSKEIDQISRYNDIEDMLSFKTLKTTINSNFQDDDLKNSAIFHENLDERIKSGTTITEMHHVDKHMEFHNKVQESKSINCSTERCEKNVECSIDRAQEQSLRTKKTDEIEKTQGKKGEKETEELIVIQKQDQQDVQKYKTSLIGITKDSVNDRLLSNKLNFDEKLIEKDICTIDSKDNLDDNETTSKNIDSSNVPTYQYFIEKELKDAKPNFIMDESVQKNLQSEMKNINKDCVQKMIKENKSTHIKQKEIYNEMTNLEFQKNDKQHARTSTSIDGKQSEDTMPSKSYKTRKQKSRESERKTVPDKVLRSSNITDLVMEGLMFTIRQDQDSVAVIEQKTKLEMDEVLENSEKVETKAGEKCLLNSSLLRLENLVTMIDSPCNRDEQHKSRHAISNGANLSSFNAFLSDAVHNVNINHADAEMDKSSISNYDKHNATNHLNLYQSQWQHQCVPSNVKNNSDGYSAGISIENHEQPRVMEWQDDDNEQNKRKYKNNTQMKKQEGDVTSEASLSKKINTGLGDTNSLMIRDTEEIDEHDKSTEGHNSPLSHSALNSTRTSTETISATFKEPSLIKPQQEANGPRIVSNKSIAIEQMPSALQKVLRHTCRPRRFSSTISSGMLQQNEQKTQHAASTGDTISKADVSLEDRTDPDIANNSLSVKLTVNSEKIKSDNEKSCVTIDKDAPETNRDVRRKNSKGKSETRRTLRRGSSSKCGSRKLQDITEEFYYDLLHVHNKDNAIRERCLRQKQRSLNDLDDIKNGGKVRIEMLKFIQDITEGARVVVRRLNMDNKQFIREKF